MAVAYIDCEMELEWEIEQNREEMRSLADQLGFLHPEVIRCSERLDELLLQYYAVFRYGRK